MPEVLATLIEDLDPFVTVLEPVECIDTAEAHQALDPACVAVP